MVRVEDLFAADRYVVRVRRLTDLSQRDLAETLGVSSSVVGRWELPEARLDTRTLSRVLALAGLRLAVLDGAGQVVSPVPRDLVRDNADRRFPAHLDVDPPEEVPIIRRLMPRYDRAPARGWYRMRELRDRRRAVDGSSYDHPTEEGLQRRQREDAVARWRQRIERAALAREQPELTCACEADCWDAGPCVQGCACQCETGRTSWPA